MECLVRVVLLVEESRLSDRCDGCRGCLRMRTEEGGVSERGEEEGAERGMGLLK